MRAFGGKPTVSFNQMPKSPISKWGTVKAKLPDGEIVEMAVDPQRFQPIVKQSPLVVIGTIIGIITGLIVIIKNLRNKKK